MPRSTLDRVRAAVASGAWEDALAALDEDDAAEASPEGLELRAMAEYGNGDFEAAVEAWERLHATLVARGEQVGAARAAAMLAMFLMMDTGLMAPVRSWLRRAEALLDGAAEGPAHALIAMTRTYERFMCGDMPAAGREAARAIDLGTRHDVGPAVVIGRVAGARVLIFEGRLDDGLNQLDDVATSLMSGGADPLTTGMMYCELICAAVGLAMHDRAREWTDVMEHWRPGAAIGGISGRCRVHRAEMLRLSGPCDEAEAEALRACEELRPWMRREFGWPLVELGNVRLRKGDLVGAEDAFLAAHQHAWSPQPGLALVRLESGDADGAAALIAEAIEHPIDIPSKERPPYGDLRLAPLLEAQVEIAFARGDETTALVAAERLTLIADRYPSPSLRASAQLASARTALLTGRADEAVMLCRQAVPAWTDLGAPFEAGVARVVLGDALAAAGNSTAAALEWEAAARSFTAFGAQRWAERALARVDGSRTAGQRRDVPSTAPITTHRATFRSEGGLRVIDFGGATIATRDLVGYRYIERMLADPGREFHVLDLVAVEQGTLRVASSGGKPEAVSDPGLPVLDDQARQAYRKRLAEVDDDIEQARAMNDEGRVALAERDREYLIAELTRAVGLGGRPRLSAGSAERARTSVTRAIKYGIERLAPELPVLAQHLAQCIETGTYCRYAPGALNPITWAW